MDVRRIPATRSRRDTGLPRGEERSQRRRKTRWPCRTPGPALPGVATQTVENAVGQRQSVAALLAGHAHWRPRPYRGDELRQLACELVGAVAGAVQLDLLEVTPEQVAPQRREDRLVERPRPCLLSPQLGRRLDQREPAAVIVSSDETLGRPDLHPSHRSCVGPACRQVSDTTALKSEVCLGKVLV